MARISLKINCTSEFPKFVGCDGRVLSDDLLQTQLENAIEREDYEKAILIRDELKRRDEEDDHVIYDQDIIYTGCFAGVSDWFNGWTIPDEDDLLRNAKEE